MKKLVLTLLTIVFGFSLFAGNGEVTKENKESDNTKLVMGKVVDKQTGEEIAGAAIKINDKVIYTDLSGNFSAAINPSQAEATVTSISYNDTKVKIDPFSYNTLVVELESK